jgi:preprotein translocase subunit SecE
MVARLFGLRLNLKNNKETWTAGDGIPSYAQTVLVGLPRSGKTAAGKALPGTIYMDLAQVVKEERAKAVIPEHSVVLLDHFEQCCANRAANERVLAFIESFVYRPDLKIIIVSTFEPLYFLDFRIPELLREEISSEKGNADLSLDRWVNALIGFHILDFVPSSPEAPRSVQWYRMVWNNCTGGERLALNQLARYGWPNYRQESALSRLARRDLVEQTTAIRIKDSGFAEFIRTSVAPSEHLHWAPQNQVTQWEAWRSVFFILVVVAILAGLLAFGDQTLAYIGTGVGAVTATTKLFATVKGKSLKEDA